MSKQKSFAQKVREKYHDTQEEFAFRLGVARVTVSGWETSNSATKLHVAMLNYANRYELPIKHTAPEEFVSLSVSDQIDRLMQYFSCNIGGLAARLHLDEATVRRWKFKNKMSSSAQRYLYEVASHPERFALFS